MQRGVNRHQTSEDGRQESRRQTVRQSGPSGYLSAHFDIS